MVRLLSKRAAPDRGPDSSTTSAAQHASTPVLISEQEVIFNTAAAMALVPPATTHRHWPGVGLIAAIGHVHIALPEPRPHYPGRDASYFEAARMSRQMEHL
jgi:hypothetical protein